MLQIFLAHANEDKDAVTRLYHRLKESGYRPWLDKEDLLPGQNWRAEIPKAIKNSQVFIACLSQQSVSKQGYVQREFRMALNEYADKPPGSIYLIPVRLDDCNIPELRQEEYGVNLRDIQWVDLFEANGLERLIKALKHGFPDSHNAQSPLSTPQTNVPFNASQKITTTQTLKNQSSSAGFTAQLGAGVTLEMVKIPGGRFWMGSPENELERYADEGPQHKVTLPSFYMGKYLVTQRQWLAVSLLDDVERSLKPTPSEFKGDDLPVEQVSWLEAVEFCQRISRHTGQEYRLPSEAEWEYTCRAGTTTPFHFGETITTDLANYRGEDRIGYRGKKYSGSYGDGPKGEYREQTTNVGRFPANDFGVHDMHGNVEEWCQDYLHDDYQGAPSDSSAWMKKGNAIGRVLRGGSWNDRPSVCRSASRSDSSLNDYGDTIGFRVSCSVPKTLM